MNGNKKELALCSENLAGVFELTDTDLAKIQGGGGDDRGDWQHHHNYDGWRHHPNHHKLQHRHSCHGLQYRHNRHC